MSGKPCWQKRLVEDYKAAGRRLLFLDYDGTLVSFFARPEEAKPDSGILRLLAALAGQSQNEVVLVSGRDRATLTTWFGALPVSLVAEHGAWLRKRGGSWEMGAPLSDAWKDQVRPVLEFFREQTPGAFVEEKEFALVFHYRLVEPEVGMRRAEEIVAKLAGLAGDLGLELLPGNKVVEVRVAGVSKGKAAVQWLRQANWDFLLAAGDDRTDEDLFAALPAGAYTIKVGPGPSRARFRVTSYQELLLLLQDLL